MASGMMGRVAAGLFTVGLAVGLAGLLVMPASAQVGISAEFTAERLSHPPVANGSGTTTLFGPTVSGYYEKGLFLAIGGDVRGSYLTGSGVSMAMGEIGPRVAFKFHPFPLQVYAEALGGANHYVSGSGNGAPSSTDVQYQLLGGLDATFFPRFDWRVIEYARTGGPGNLSGNSFSTGLVFRIPFL